MRGLTEDELFRLHDRIIGETGGLPGVISIDSVKSAVLYPFQSFDGRELFPTLEDKAAALAHLICRNHPFTDGNKRTAHAALEVFLVLNGYELDANPGEAEALFVQLAEGTVLREQLADWIRANLISRETGTSPGDR